MGQMNGKTSIITGGAGSIGLASARRLLEEGANVMLVDRDGEQLSRAGKSLAAHGKRVATTTADVTQAKDTTRYIARTLESFGASGDIKPITDYPEADFDWA